MPQAIPYIAIAISIASAVYAASLDLSTEPKDTGTIINKSGTRATRDVVYGRCITGATPLWSNVKDTSMNELVQVFSTGIAVSEIHQLFIDDVAVLALTSNYRENTDQDSLIFTGNQLANGFEKQCSIQLRTGFPIGAPIYNGLPVGTPMNLAIDNSDGEWTNAMRGDYTSMVCVKSLRIIDDESIRIMSESYAINMEVSGVPVFDPRTSTDPANKSYSRNPALCALDYITNTYYGMGISFNHVDLDSFKTVANHCDANDFYIDGQLNQGDSFASNLDNICKTAQIHLFIENGKLVCRAEAASLPSWSFNESNILKGTLQVTEQTSQSYANVITVNYKNSDLDDKDDTYTIPDNIYPLNTDPSYPSRPQSDGYVATTELDMPMTRYRGSNSNDIFSPMKKFANMELRRQDFQKEIEFDMDKEEYNISLFDVIEVSDEAIGWDKKLFRINGFSTRISEDEMNIVKLKCKEYSSTIFDGTMDGTPPSEKPKPPVVVAPPTALSFTLHDLIVSGSATLGWTRTWFETNAQFDVEYKKSSELTWTRLGRTSTNEWKFPNLYPDTYDFRVATWSNLYGSSSFTELTDVVVSSLGVFPPVTGLSCDTTTQDFKFSWDDMLDKSVTLPPDPRPESPSNPLVRDYFSHYQVDIFNVTTLLGTYQATSNFYDYTYTINKANGILRTIRANVYIVAKDGTKSQLGNADLTATNPQQSAPNGIIDSTELSNTIITWNQPNDFNDYRATRFYQSTVQGFTPNQSTFLKEQVGTLFSHIWDDKETHYIKFAHVDVFGNDNEAYSNEISVTSTGLDGILPIDDRFGEIRDPSGAIGPEQVFKSASGEYVAGVGIYANESMKDTTILMAAENILMGVGGRPYYDNVTQYIAGDKVLFLHGPNPTTDTGLYTANVDTIGNPPIFGGNTEWSENQSNVNKSVVAVNENGKVLIENAVIEDLTSDNIKTRSIIADSIEADSITGNEINSTTTITAGIDATVDPIPTNHGMEVGSVNIGTVLDFNGYNTEPNRDRSGFENVFDYNHGDWYGGITGFAISADGGVGYYTIGQVRSGMPPEFRIYKSTNGCATWTNLGNKGWNGASKVICSSDGQFVYVSDIDGGYIWRSTNGASTFTRVAFIGAAGFISMACSGDGQTVYYSSENGELWKSTNQAASFTIIQTTSFNSRSIAINDDGRIIYAQSNYSDATQTIISKSEDYGSSFTQVYSESVITNESHRWDLACSLDGDKVYGTRGRDDYTVESKNGGVDFRVIGIPEWTNGTIYQIELAYAHYEDRLYFATTDGNILPAEKLAIFKTGTQLQPLGSLSPPNAYHTDIIRIDEIYDNNYNTIEQSCQIEFTDTTEYIPNPMIVNVGGINYTFTQIGNTPVWDSGEVGTILSSHSGASTTIILPAAALPEPIALAGMNGNDSDFLPGGADNIYKGYRFWSGASDPNDAAFRVFSDGKMQASNAIVKGHIEADTGYFAGNLESPTINGGEINGGYIRGGVIEGAVFIQTETVSTVRPVAYYPDGEKIVTKTLPYSSSQTTDIINYGYTSTLQGSIKPYNSTQGYGGDPLAEKEFVRYLTRELTNSTSQDGSLFGFSMSGQWADPIYDIGSYASTPSRQCYLRIEIDIGGGWQTGVVNVGYMHSVGGGIQESYIAGRNGNTTLNVGGIPLRVVVSGANYSIYIDGVYQYSGNNNIKVRGYFYGGGYTDYGRYAGKCNIKLREYANNAIGGATLASQTANVNQAITMSRTAPTQTEPETDIGTFRVVGMQVMERFSVSGEREGLFLGGRKLNEKYLFE